MMNKTMNKMEMNKMLTVKDLIEMLKEYPQDMPIGAGDPYDGIELRTVEWVHGNYPYDKPSFDYVCIY